MRGFCLVALLLLPWMTSAAPPGSANALPSLSKDEAAQALQAFRNSGLNCDLVIRFELKHLPRSGDAGKPEKGTLWMSWKHGFPAVRIEMGNTRFLMLRRNSESLLWQYQDNVVTKISGTDALKPLIPGYLFAPFDLQAPFTHWQNTVYESTERHRGRPLNMFLAKAPSDNPSAPVRFGLDRAYVALIEATTLDANGKPSRQMLIEDFAQVDEQWILGKASVRDEVTRDRDVLEAKSACVNARLEANIFSPESLAKPAPATEGTFHSL